MMAKFVRDFLKSKTTTAAAALIGARTGADPTLVTDAEAMAQTGTTVRAWTPAMVKAAANRSGTTAQRPTTSPVGFSYYDTTLNKPVWLKTTPSTWVDATGTAA
jgi:hypothetical protein